MKKPATVHTTDFKYKEWQQFKLLVEFTFFDLYPRFTVQFYAC